jgi:protein-S-isoprenylcysteine O-methyltransferase Ste14
MCFVLALALVVAAFLAFRKHRTTYHPQNVDKARTLLTSGIFGFSRNPMYLGMALVLAGWAFYLASPLAVLGVVFFVAYIQRFQIVPEERALGSTFGADYAAYCARVRRWI